MCGIAGFLIGNDPTDVSEHVLRNMTGILDYRGPDAEGFWIDRSSGIALGHRRLSIIDLTTAGSQPMHSSCGSCVISYNGEIYNANDLRRDLEKSGRCFRGHSDTEVIVEACATWGIEKSVMQLIGMFAFALWDRSTKTLYLVRDRLGIKPLYWGRFGGFFLFGSELKALRAHPGWQAEINRDALAAYMRHNYIPAPYTIYKGIYKLSPGCILTIRSGQEPQISHFWKMEDTVCNGQNNRKDLDDEEAILTTENILADAVSSRMIADVPLGAFLSGGIDSSTVVALMQRSSNQNVKTFSIGFREDDYNEAIYARDIASHLGTDHTEFYVSPQDALDVVPGLPDMYDEPFADSSQIPTYLVSKLTRQYVTVALSGDGGDEVFAGYNRYFFAKSLAQKLGWMTRPGQQLLKQIIYLFPPATWSRLFRLLPGKFNLPHAGDKLHKLAKILAADKSVVYRRLVSHWDDPEDLVINAREPDGVLVNNEFISEINTFIEQMQYLDTVTYLPDDILTKVDRASMAVSLEARVPLLDHRVVEHAWSLPLSMKIRNGKSKWILRQILYKYIPSELVERPKMGFGIPIGEWLRGPLRDWAESLLDEQHMREQGFLNPVPVKQKWEEHLSGDRNWQYHLWNILMFQAWYERWIT